MDRDEILNDQEESMRLMLDGRQAMTWTAMPGIIESINLTAMTCSVNVAILAPITDENGNSQNVQIKPLLDVPIVFPSGGGFTITFPLAIGDEVLVVIASRCIDAWWQLGGVQQPIEARMHDLSDGFAIPGPKSQPNVIDDISSTKLEIRSDDGDTYISINPANGKFRMANALTDLKTVLNNLVSAVNGFMTTMSALTPPTTPVLNSVLQVPGALAETDLTLVSTAIGELLE